MRKVFLLLFCLSSLGFSQCDQGAFNQFANEFDTQFSSEYIVPQLEKCIDDKREETREAHETSNEFQDMARETDDYGEKADLVHQQANYLADAGAACMAVVMCAEKLAQVEGSGSTAQILAEQERLVCNHYLETSESLGATAGLYDNRGMFEDEAGHLYD